MTGIVDFGMVCALGQSTRDCESALVAGKLPSLDTRVIADGSRVPVFAVEGHVSLPREMHRYDCRNNRLAYMCYQQIASAVENIRGQISSHRLGVVLGSSTSGLDASEHAYHEVRSTGQRPENYHFDTQHAMGSLSQFVAELAGAKGPAYTVSTACSSAAKAMISAKGLLDAGVCDAVITGGVDSLCSLTVNGFFALGQLSDVRMNPLSQNRCGLNIGEGGALFVLTRQPAKVELLGGGESMDAYHMSAPLPDGQGAALAMKRALVDAGVAAHEVAYVNLHGTATKANDAMETLAVAQVVPDAPVSSSKPLFGHCLGAAGALEAAVCCLSLLDDEGRLPVHVYDGHYDPQLSSLKLVREGSCFFTQRSRRVVMSNSFAFGGNNCALVMSAVRKGKR